MLCMLCSEWMRKLLAQTGRSMADPEEARSLSGVESGGDYTMCGCEPSATGPLDERMQSSISSIVRRCSTGLFGVIPCRDSQSNLCEESSVNPRKCNEKSRQEMKIARVMP
jgi:hypothetical protein